MVGNYGCVSRSLAVENPLESANAYGRKDRRVCRHESGNIVSLRMGGSRIMLTSSQSRSHVDYKINIHREIDSAGCIM
jgi:hypothetical protein